MSWFRLLAGDRKEVAHHWQRAEEWVKANERARELERFRHRE